MPYPDEFEIQLPSGITLNGARDIDGVLYTCATLDGWGSPAGTGGGTAKAGAHGESVPRQWMQARTMTATGRIDAPTPLLRQRAQHKLEAALGLDLFPLTVVDAIPLRVQVYRSADISRVDDTDTQATWQAELKAPDPRRYGATHSYLLNLPTTTGGDTWPEQWPEQFDGTTSFGDIKATNDGNFTAPIKITFTGPLTSPTLTSTTLGQSVTYNGVLAAGEYVDVYLNTPIVALLMGKASRTGRVSTAGGGPWGMRPGANDIAFRAPAGTGTALLTFDDCYL